MAKRTRKPRRIRIVRTRDTGTDVVKLGLVAAFVAAAGYAVVKGRTG